MESTIKQPVVSLNAHRANSLSRVEVEASRHCIPMLSWDLQVQQVIALCGLSISEALLADLVLPAASSHAAQLGHKSVESLVSKPESQDGLALDWADFKNKIKGLVYKQKYSINESNYQEIIDQVADSIQIIGRMPVDASEFHGAKEKALTESIAQIRKDLQSRIDSLQESQKDLLRDINREKSENNELKQARTALMQESASKIQAMTRELAVKLEASEKDSLERIKIESSRIESEFNNRLEEAKKDLKVNLDLAEASRKEAELSLNALNSRIDSGELIEVGLFNEQMVKLEAARQSESSLRSQLLDINDQLEKSKLRVEQQEAENAAHLDTIEKMGAQIKVFEQKILEVVEDKVGTTEFAVLHERLEMRRQEIDSLSSQLAVAMVERDKYKISNVELRGKFQQMKQMGSEHFRRLSDQLQDLNGKYASVKSENGQMKTMMIIVSTVAVLAGLSLVLQLA